MALVVPWHAGTFFAIRGQGTILLEAGLWLSHSFRMPLFFLLAGFLGTRVAGSRGDGDWLRGRVVRLGAPLLVGTAALALFIGLFARWQNEAGEHQSLLEALTHPRPAYLWFLWYLLLITVACLAVREAGRLLGRRVPAGRLLPENGASVLTIALLAAPCALAAWSTGTWNPAAPDDFLAPAGLLAYYGVFFGVGWLLGARPIGLDVIGIRPGRRLALAIAAAVPAFWLFAHSGDPGIAGNPAIRLVALYLGAICCWCLIAGLIGLFKRHTPRELPGVRYAADASYWIYLSHMLFLAPLQLLLLGLMPGIVQFALAVLATFVLALGTYELFVRYSAIGRVLHGPRSRKASGSIRQERQQRVKLHLGLGKLGGGV
jgi:surface polysaccharide O-acyltransferase-like enzyme